MPRELKVEIQTVIYTSMFTAASFTLAKRQKQPKCLSTSKCINKMWSMHTMEYDFTIKRSEILKQATTEINL